MKSNKLKLILQFTSKNVRKLSKVFRLWCDQRYGMAIVVYTQSGRKEIVEINELNCWYI